MTLAAKPVLIEEGEWLAHQGKQVQRCSLPSLTPSSVVENSRLLDGLLKIFQDTDRRTGMPICNQHTCPAMTAGPGITYTWLDQNRQPVRVPAPDNIRYVQRWINNKVSDPAHFPTDTFSQAAPSLNSRATLGTEDESNWLGKASGFPNTFPSELRNMYRQMFRCYAHIYHAHWLDCWNLNAYRELNTCFIHFVNVGRLFGLLNEKDLEPMQPLIDIWLDKGWLPRPASASSSSAAAAGGLRPALASRQGSTSSQTPGGGYSAVV